MTIEGTGDTAVDETAQEPLKPQPRTLAELRHAAGLSLTQVADRMGVGKNHVSKIEARFPHLNYDTLTRYITALGGSVHFTVGTAHAHADQLIADPERTATREYLKQRPGMGNLVYVPASATEELPLQEETAQPGDDHTGGQEDHADTQSDQGDSGQTEQP